MSAFAEELLSRFRWIGGHADVLGLLSDGEFFTHAIHALAEPFAEARVMVEQGDRVLLVDDWAETGSQALAARALIEDCGGTWAGASLLVDQLQADVRSRLGPVRAFVLSLQLPPNPGWATRWS